MLIIYYLVSKRANLPLPAMVLLFFIVLFACRQGPQEEKYEYQGFHYEHFAWGLQITGYTGKSKDIKFPAQINNLPVIS
ncbi:MAG: hypothetical protein FWH41_10800, partial [Treponema sp.]|nr:hypothetical protein [Treponema sp.]